MPQDRSEPNSVVIPSRSKDAIIIAIATILAAVIAAAATIIVGAKREKTTLETEVATLQGQVDSKTREAKTLAATVVNLQQQVSQLSSKPTQPSPVQTSTATRAPDDLTQEVDSIAITLTRVHLSGDVLTFEFQVLNKAPADQTMSLFGAGSFGNGSSRFIADGQEYAATSVRVGNETWDGIVAKRFVSGIPLNGYVAFKGVPRSLRSVAILELAYSYNNLRPAGAFRFSNVAVE
jgi:hypothetical protein